MDREAFISYASPDKQVAEAVCAALEVRKVTCWIAPRDIPPGTPYPEAIMAALNSCQLLVLVFSAATNESPHVLREVERVVSRKQPIVPIRIADSPPRGAMEYLISSSQWIDAMAPSIDDHLERVTVAVERLLRRPIASEAARPPTLTLAIEERQLSDLADCAVAMSQGAFKEHARKLGREFSSRQLRSTRDEPSSLALPSTNAVRAFLYDERLSEAPSEDLYRSSILQILRRAHQQSIRSMWVYPTGRTRGFPRARALDCALQGYEQYVEQALAAGIVNVRSFRFALNASDPYESRLLFGSIERFLNDERPFARRYRTEARRREESPLSLGFTLAAL